MSGLFFNNLLAGSVDLLRDELRVSLFSSTTHLPDYELPQKYGSFPYTQSYEVGWPLGGIELTGKSLTGNSDGGIKFDAADATWANQTISAQYAVIWDAAPGKGRITICDLDFGGTFSTTSGNFTINWDSSGVFNFDLGCGGERLIYPKAWELG